MVLVTEIENTLWGMIIDGKTQIEHKSDRPIHISMAALDTSSKFDEFVPVMIHYGDKSHIICTLNASKYLQQSLDLEINKGEVVSFSLNSNGVVHLTGYYVQEEIMDDSQMDDYMGEEEEGEYDHENCDHPHDIMDGYGNGHDMSDEDDDDEDDEDDEDDDGSMNSEDYDNFGGEDDDVDEEDEEEEEEEPPKPVQNGKKRKLEQETKANKKKKNKRESLPEESEEEEEEPPKLVKPAEKPQKVNKKEENNKKQPEPQTKNVNGIQIKDIKAGNGPEAKKGKYVHVYYQGKLKQNGKQFDACQSGKPFKFRLGSGEVIKGWDIGVAGMKVGSKRILTIPPHLAYGNQKLGGIPPNSTLVFEVELKAIS